MPPSLPISNRSRISKFLIFKFTLNPTYNLFVIAMATPEVAAMWERGFRVADARRRASAVSSSPPAFPAPDTNSDPFRTFLEISTDSANNSKESSEHVGEHDSDTFTASEDAGEHASDTFTASQKQQLQKWMMMQILQHNDIERVWVRQELDTVRQELDTQRSGLDNRLREEQAQFFDLLQQMFHQAYDRLHSVFAEAFKDNLSNEERFKTLQERVDEGVELREIRRRLTDLEGAVRVLEGTARVLEGKARVLEGKARVTWRVLVRFILEISVRILDSMVRALDRRADNREKELVGERPPRAENAQMVGSSGPKFARYLLIFVVCLMAYRLHVELLAVVLLFFPSLAKLAV
ncbi:hypothetical protein BV25DRAFT_1843262 [Artomyces pyxidatus]|uniref:Uncharacterized protein n=1 Tax=Artomyces pyxidatus TaxID=48021 RepID=A0ACB8SEP0_9AGAM|nr:hypothetical protein BV25DRAFT_1843262 [Artomyces pyxidatus]